MKTKFMAAILGLGLLVAIPGAVIAVAQNPEDQSTDPYSKPSPNVQAPVPGPNDQGPADQGSMDQDSMNPGSASPDSANQGPMDPGSNDNSGNGATSNSPAPVESNGVARIS